MSRAGKLAQDPTDWANKRKAAVERAKALREERKNGAPDDSHTFAPQINKRPSYLDQAAKSDALDDLANNFSSTSSSNNDIFEKPLPGKKDYNIATDKGSLSPGMDALGKEMRKYSPRTDISNTFEFNGSTKSNSGLSRQYSEPIKQLSSGEISRTTDAESDEAFFSSLRGGNNSNSRSNRPGWNDDFSGSGKGIDNSSQSYMKGRPPLNPSGNSRSNIAQDTQKDSTNTRPRNTSNSSSSKAEWNNDFTSNSDDSSSVQSSSVHASPRSVMKTARSRLSLLKSKIRQTESSGSSRQQNEYVETTTAPRSAPLYQDSDRYSNPDQSFNRIPSQGKNDNLGYSASSNSSSNTRNKPSAMPMPPSAHTSSYRDSVGEYTPRGLSKAAQQIPEPVPSPRPPRESAAAAAIAAEYEDGSNYDEEVYVGEQIQCPDCERKFNPASFTKHSKICAKVFLQKRKVFDSKKMRVADNPELVKILKNVEKANKKAASKPAASEAPIATSGSDSKWKDQSNAFREAMKAARQVSKAIAEGAPLPPPKISAPDPSFIPCPHCGRRFNEKAAERHIPLCSNIIAKPTKLKKGSNHSAAAGVAKTQQRGAKF